ncbi:MAG: 50S ribosomal protein L10 [Geminicoccaceae bacterium]
MLKAQKTVVVDQLRGVFSEAGVVVITSNHGLSVAEVTDLRRQVLAAGANFKVAKNRLAKIAIEGTPFAATEPLFKGPTAIAYSADPTAAPKVVSSFIKKNNKLTIVGGGLSGTLLTPDQVKALADMPSIDELRAKLLGVLNAPAANFLSLLNAPASKLVTVLSAPNSKMVGVLRAKSQQS